MGAREYAPALAADGFSIVTANSPDASTATSWDIWNWGIPLCAKVRRDGAANFSPPPQGGRESTQAPPQPNLAPRWGYPGFMPFCLITDTAASEARNLTKAVAASGSLALAGTAAM